MLVGAQPSLRGPTSSLGNHQWVLWPCLTGPHTYYGSHWLVLQLSPACFTTILVFMSTRKCWSLAQSGLPPDPGHTYADGYWNLTQSDLPTVLHYLVVGASAYQGSPQSFPTRPVTSSRTCMCQWVLGQPGIACPYSQLSMGWWML